jgi:hypothetical protein
MCSGVLDGIGVCTRGSVGSPYGRYAVLPIFFSWSTGRKLPLEASLFRRRLRRQRNKRMARMRTARIDMTTERMILRSVLLLERPPEEAEDELSVNEALGMGAAACVSVIPEMAVSDGAGKSDEVEVIAAEEVIGEEEDVNVEKVVDETNVVEEVVDEVDVVEEVLDDEANVTELLVSAGLSPEEEEDVDDSCLVLRLELVDEVVLVGEIVLLVKVVLLDEVVLPVLDTAVEVEEGVKLLLLGVVAATVPLGVIDQIQETT